MAEPGTTETGGVQTYSVADASAFLAGLGFEGPQPSSLLDVITGAHIADHMRQMGRAGMYEDGTFQTNADHTYRLQLMVLQVAASQREDLNAAHAVLLAQTHDLPEVYGGDTPITDEELLATKAEREEAGAVVLLQELASSTFMAELIREYKALETPEARFVYAMDKYEATDFALHTKATTQRVRGDEFPELVGNQLPKTVIDPTVFHLMVRGFKLLGQNWEAWGCKPFDGTADEVVDAAVREIVEHREDLRDQLLEDPLILPEDAPARP